MSVMQIGRAAAIQLSKQVLAHKEAGKGVGQRDGGGVVLGGEEHAWVISTS